MKILVKCSWFRSEQVSTTAGVDLKKQKLQSSHIIFFHIVLASNIFFHNSVFYRLEFCK